MFGQSRPSQEMITAVLARKTEEPKLNLLKGLSPDKITWVKQQLKKPPVSKNTAKINASRVALPADMSPHRAAKITPPKMRTVYDKVRAEKLRHLREVLCAAHDHNIPDLPGVCRDVVVLPRGRPIPERPLPPRPIPPDDVGPPGAHRGECRQRFHHEFLSTWSQHSERSHVYRSSISRLSIRSAASCCSKRSCVDWLTRAGVDSTKVGFGMSSCSICNEWNHHA
jgi:hypothetical protein